MHIEARPQDILFKSYRHRSVGRSVGRFKEPHAQQNLPKCFPLTLKQNRKLYLLLSIYLHIISDLIKRKDIRVSHNGPFSVLNNDTSLIVNKSAKKKDNKGQNETKRKSDQ